MGKVAVVTEIQVGGAYLASSLEETCLLFVSKQPARPKISFAIRLPNGETKYITIRDEDEMTVAYGDFEGLPSMLEYAKEVLNEVEERLCGEQANIYAPLSKEARKHLTVGRDEMIRDATAGMKEE